MIKDTPDHPICLTWKNAAQEKSSPICILMREYPARSDLWHRHEDYRELVFVLSGKAVNEMTEGQVCIGGGDLFAMPQGSVHHYTGISRFRHYVILLKPDILTALPGGFRSLDNFRLLFQDGKNCSPVLHIGEKELPGAIERIENARNEYLNRYPGWMESVCTEFFRALIYMLRNARPAGEQPRQTANQISSAVRHMEENLSKEHTLRSLSAGARMSVSNFRLRFREIMGLSPIDYLIRLRLKRAMLLLVYTDQPVSEVLLQTGFTDSSYFTRQFHAAFGMTPRQFRKAVQAGQITPSEELQRLLERNSGENKKTDAISKV